MSIHSTCIIICQKVKIEGAISVLFIFGTPCTCTQNRWHYKPRTFECLMGYGLVDQTPQTCRENWFYQKKDISRPCPNNYRYRLVSCVWLWDHLTYVSVFIYFNNRSIRRWNWSIALHSIVYIPGHVQFLYQGWHYA